MSQTSSVSRRGQFRGQFKRHHHSSKDNFPKRVLLETWFALLLFFIGSFVQHRIAMANEAINSRKMMQPPGGLAFELPVATSATKQQHYVSLLQTYAKSFEHSELITGGFQTGDLSPDSFEPYSAQLVATATGVQATLIINPYDRPVLFSALAAEIDDDDDLKRHFLVTKHFVVDMADQKAMTAVIQEVVMYDCFQDGEDGRGFYNCLDSFVTDYAPFKSYQDTLDQWEAFVEAATTCGDDSCCHMGCCCGRGETVIFGRCGLEWP